MTEEQTLVIQESMASAWAEEDEQWMAEIQQGMVEFESEVERETNDEYWARQLKLFPNRSVTESIDAAAYLDSYGGDSL